MGCCTEYARIQSWATRAIFPHKFNRLVCRSALPGEENLLCYASLFGVYELRRGKWWCNSDENGVAARSGPNGVCVWSMATSALTEPLGRVGEFRAAQ
jgi:hypothetical protein